MQIMILAGLSESSAATLKRQLEQIADAHGPLLAGTARFTQRRMAIKLTRNFRGRFGSQSIYRNVM